MVASPADGAGGEVKERILELMVEKTGYPKDMLDVDLDLEADLGVDTVKQAEMFAAIREIYNNLSRATRTASCATTRRWRMSSGLCMKSGPIWLAGLLHPRTRPRYLRPQQFASQPNRSQRRRR